MSGITEGQSQEQQPADEQLHQPDHPVSPDAAPTEHYSPAGDDGAQSSSETAFVAAFQSIASYYSRPNSPTVLFSGYPIDLQTPSFEEVDRAAARIGLEVKPFSGKLSKHFWARLSHSFSESSCENYNCKRFHGDFLRNFLIRVTKISSDSFIKAGDLTISLYRET